MDIAAKQAEIERLMRQLNAKIENESEDHRAIRIGRAMHDLEALGFDNILFWK